MSETLCTDRGGRGCPCAWHARRRVYARNHARKVRGRKIQATRMQSRTCPRRFGRFGVCGAVLESTTVNGRLVVSCPACERLARGICRDCPAPVAGRIRSARRCAACKAKYLRAASEKYAENNRALLRKRARDSYRHDDETRRRRNEYKRLWRAANPDKVREQKARGTQRADYQAEYRRQHRTRLANYARKVRQGDRPLRTCITPGCSIVVTHRKRKCTRCKARDRAQAQQILAMHQARRAA